MMNEGNGMLTLDRPATYQIKVPGELNESWVDWAGTMTMRVESAARSRHSPRGREGSLDEL